jgi:hypothetical protein
MTLLQSILGRFRKKPLATLPALDDFIDERAAFIAQKCVVEYARARSGVLSEKLFKEEAFIEALTRSRWTSYTLTACDVAEMVMGKLQPHSDLTASRLAAALALRVGCVFARYPLPPHAPGGFWEEASAMLGRELARAALAEPRPVKDIPLERAKRVFDSLPVHESMRQHDYVLIQNNLRTNLVRAHEDFVGVADLSALARALDEAAEGA